MGLVGAGVGTGVAAPGRGAGEVIFSAGEGAAGMDLGAGTGVGLTAGLGSVRTGCGAGRITCCTARAIDCPADFTSETAELTIDPIENRPCGSRRLTGSLPAYW